MIINVLLRTFDDFFSWSDSVSEWVQLDSRFNKSPEEWYPSYSIHMSVS
jgi:hypothetical protein